MAPIALGDLQEVDRRRSAWCATPRSSSPASRANNVLLTGARGTGKSSLIKACLNEFAPRGLRLIEVDKADLVDLPDIVDLVAERPERFIVFCDDLSFDEGEPGYKALKIHPRWLGRAGQRQRADLRHQQPPPPAARVHEGEPELPHTEDGEVHPGEVVEEKISLSERFGLWISFYPFSQEEYLAIVASGCAAWCRRGAIAAARQDALVWALERGSRSGRVAYQFARDWAGAR